MHPFKNIHDFLEVKIGDRSITDSEIASLKAEYWKGYWKYYRRRARSTKREFTIRLCSETLDAIEQVRGPYSVSQFLYRCVYHQLEDSRKISESDRELLEKIHADLMDFLQLLEEVYHRGGNFNETTLDRIETLEGRFNSFLNQHL